MNFRLVWKIFLKDVQRLWWVILLTLLLLGRLAHFDSWRGTKMPGSEEGWLNILLPLAWSLLIALAVFEDSAAAESPFWMTLPCRWRPVLAAKVLFTAAFIHVPYFIACATILQARGFGILENFPTLLLRQLILFALTIPALGLATVVRNVTQYMCVALVLATIVGALPMGGEPYLNAGLVRELREAIVIAVAALAGVWIAFAQYGHRILTRSRVVGIAAIVIATVVWWIPSERFDGLQAAFFPLAAQIPRPKIRSAEGQKDVGFIGQQTGVFIPISVTEPPAGYAAQFRQGDVEVREADGRTDSAEPEFYRVRLFGGANDLTATFADMGGTGPIPNRQALTIDRRMLSRIGAAPITVHGSALGTYHRNLEPVWIPLNQTVPIAGVGICTSEIRGDFPHDENLHVGCESAHMLPMVHVTLLDTVGNRQWKNDLNSSRTLLDYPTGTWLSPVDRADTYFPLTDEEHHSKPAAKWQTPREVLPTARIGITPSISQGSALIYYELPNVRLDEYKVH